MLQVMTQNHFGACAAKTRPNVRGQGAYGGKGGQVPHVHSGFFFRKHRYGLDPLWATVAVSTRVWDSLDEARLEPRGPPSPMESSTYGNSTF